LEPIFSPPIIVLLNSGMKLALPSRNKEATNEKV
jgi:hypothetical protein